LPTTFVTATADYSGVLASTALQLLSNNDSNNDIDPESDDVSRRR